MIIVANRSLLANDTALHSVIPSFWGLSSNSESMTQAALIISIVYYTIAAVAISFSNILIIYTIASCDKLKNSRGFIKFSIALADVIVGLIVLPHSIVKAIDEQISQHEEMWGTPENCFFAILYTTSRSVSLQSSVFLLFDCWIQTTKPSVYKMFTKRDCIPIISGIWILAFTCSLATIRNTNSKNKLSPLMHLNSNETGWACCVYQIITTPGGAHIDKSAFRFEFDLGFAVGYIVPTFIGIILIFMIRNFQKKIKKIYLTKYKKLGKRASFVALEHVNHIWNSCDQLEGLESGVPADVSNLVSQYIEARVSCLNTKNYDDDGKSETESSKNNKFGDIYLGINVASDEEEPVVNMQPEIEILNPEVEIPKDCFECEEKGEQCEDEDCKRDSLRPSWYGRTKSSCPDGTRTPILSPRYPLKTRMSVDRKRMPIHSNSNPSRPKPRVNSQALASINYEKLRKDLQHNMLVQDWIAEKELAAEAVLYEPLQKAYFKRNSKISRKMSRLTISNHSSRRNSCRSVGLSIVAEDESVRISDVSARNSRNRSTSVRFEDLEKSPDGSYRQYTLPVPKTLPVGKVSATSSGIEDLIRTPSPIVKTLKFLDTPVDPSPKEEDTMLVSRDPSVEFLDQKSKRRRRSSTFRHVRNMSRRVLRNKISTFSVPKTSTASDRLTKRRESIREFKENLQKFGQMSFDKFARHMRRISGDRRLDDDLDSLNDEYPAINVGKMDTLGLGQD